MRKLLYVSNIRLPTKSAHGVQIMKMCEAFAGIGVDVELVVPRRLNPIKKDPFDYYGVKKIFKIRRLPTIDLIRTVPRLGFWIETIVFSKFVLLSGALSGADIVYSRDVAPVWFLSFFKKNLYWEAHQAHKSFLVDGILSRCKRIVAINKGLADFYIQAGAEPSKMMVAHDAVDLEDFSVSVSKKEARKKLSLPIDKKIIGYVGRFKTKGRAKGVEDLIKSFSGILEVNKDSFLLLVGMDKTEITELESLIKEENVPGNSYALAPHVPHREVINYLRASDLLVMNYPPDEHYARFMSPLKLFEYMASGRPIIASDLPSVREILNDENSILIKPGNYRDLTQKTIDALKDEPKLERIATNARRKVERYTWSNRAEKILKFTE